MTDEINMPKRRGRPPSSKPRRDIVDPKSPSVNVRLSRAEHERLSAIQKRQPKKSIRAILVDGIIQAENDADLDDIAPLV